MAYYSKHSFGTKHNPEISHSHSNHASHQLDTYLHPYTLVVGLLVPLSGNPPLIVFDDMHHKNELYPNKTIEQPNNKIYT